MSTLQSPSSDRPVRAEAVVDLAAIRHNVATLRARAAGAQLMTVVKADGYGHGMVPVARAAREAGADWIGAAVLEEALALRDAGDTGPIFCWLTTPGEPLERRDCRRHRSVRRRALGDRRARRRCDRPAGPGAPEDRHRHEPRRRRTGGVAGADPGRAPRAAGNRPDRDQGHLVAPVVVGRAEESGERVPARDLHRGDRAGGLVRRRRRVQAPGELRCHARAARDPLQPGPVRASRRTGSRRSGTRCRRPSSGCGRR